MSSVRMTVATPRNRLLALLPETEYFRLLPHLKPVELAVKQVIYESRGAIDHAYFPTGAIASSLTVMLDGGEIEVATVGDEGLVGHILALGIDTSPNKVIVQAQGPGLEIKAAILREEVAWGGSLQRVLINYHSVFMTQVSQSVACNGLHRLEQRCCRWLLMTRDRVRSDDLRLTHEFLGVMLGVRRAGVTEVLGRFQEAGLTRSQRGRIIILDRAGLESRCCECYRVVRDEYERLLGPIR